MHTYPNKITPELQDVLGLMIMQTAPIAHALRREGTDIPCKAEAEQAHVLHWMIGLTLEHGAGWRKIVHDRLGSIAEAAREAAEAEWEPDPEFQCRLCDVIGHVQTKERESSCGGYDIYYHRCAACSGNWKSEDGPDG